MHPRVNAAATKFAEVSAQRVGEFILALGQSTANAAIPLTAELLLALGAALQVRLWRHDGHRLDNQLGEIADAIIMVVQGLASNTLDSIPQVPDWYPLRVMRLAIEVWSWDAPAIIGADVHVGQLDEDQVVDLLAEILWQNRNRGVEK